MTRYETICQLRDAAVALVRLRGQQRCSRLGIEMDVRIHGIQISLRPAFDSGNSYGLDIWAPNKVLNVEWNEAGHIKTTSFRRGSWEQLLLSAAQQIYAPNLQ
jgi:hypothetical protein